MILKEKLEKIGHASTALAALVALASLLLAFLAYSESNSLEENRSKMFGDLLSLQSLVLAPNGDVIKSIQIIWELIIPIIEDSENMQIGRQDLVNVLRARDISLTDSSIRLAFHVGLTSGLITFSAPDAQTVRLPFHLSVK